MKNMKVSNVLIVLVGGLIFHQYATAQYKVPSSVFSSGGSQITGPPPAGYRIVGTVGQPLIGVATSPSYTNAIGFWYQAGGLVTSVEQLSSSLPAEYRLEQNYPNPFNPSTTIQFALPKRSVVTLKLFDMLGREVATLVDEELRPGEYKVVFDASSLSTGVYFYRLQAGGPSTGSGQGFSQTKKVMLLK